MGHGDINKSLKDLEKEYAGKKHNSQEIDPIFKANYEKRLNIPLNKLVIFLVIVVGGLYAAYTHKQKVLSYVPPEYLEKTDEFVEKVGADKYLPDELKKMSEKYGNKDFRKNLNRNSSSTNQTSAVVSGSDSGEGLAAIPHGENEKNFVQIRGKYYRKSPNDIYIINGERIWVKNKK